MQNKGIVISVLKTLFFRSYIEVLSMKRWANQPAGAFNIGVYHILRAAILFSAISQNFRRILKSTPKLNRIRCAGYPYIGFFNI
jgi:hypothetical protein